MKKKNIYIILSLCVWGGGLITLQSKIKTLKFFIEIQLVFFFFRIYILE